MVDEPGSDQAGALWDSAARVATSLLGYAEGRAALAAARRARRLTARSHARALAEFEGRWSEVFRVGVDDGCVQAAGALAELHALRGYDAIHLASAIALGPDVAVVTWDQALHTAAADEDLLVAPAALNR